MVLVQLLLPTTRAGKDAEHAAGFAQTRQELAERFSGLTAYVRSPAKGMWTSRDGDMEQDDVVMVEVVTPTFDREWWRAYTAILRKRFEQDAIHVRALAIEMLDHEAA